jgi:IclR family transcriptional regulator, KDG regulon repressor
MLTLKHLLNEKYFVVSVKNAMRILRLFTPKENEFGVTEIAKKLDLSKSTVHRYIKELVQEGFLVQNKSNGHYRLGLSNLALGGIVQLNKEIYSEAIPILTKLANRFHLPAHICVMEHNHVVYLIREMGDQPVKLITKSGRYNDLHCTAEGLTILAFRSKEIIDNVLTQSLKKYTKYTFTDPEIIKQQILKIHYDRYAVTKDMYALGFISLAAPIQDYTGEVVSSLALIGDSKNVTENQYGEIIAELQSSAKKISELLGYYDNQ